MVTFVIMGYNSARHPSEESCWTGLSMCVVIGVFISACWVLPLILLEAILPGGTMKSRFLLGVFVWFLCLNLLTLFINAIDKMLAKCSSGQDCVVRVPEKVLHFFTLLGGAPGTVAAMFVVCHKRSKAPYRKVFCIYAIFSVFFVGAAFGIGYAATRV